MLKNLSNQEYPWKLHWDSNASLSELGDPVGYVLVESLPIVGRNTNKFREYRVQYGDSLKKKKIATK